MEWLNLIISLISGAAGGFAAGRLIKGIDMGTLWNSLAGVVGGGLGGQIVAVLIGDPGAAVGDASGVGMLGSVLAQIIGGGVGGGLLLAIVSYVKQMFTHAPH